MAALRFRPVALFAALAALVALAVGASGAQGAVATPTIHVNYTDQCTFTITNNIGRPAMQIPPGTYRVNVNTPTPFANIGATGNAARDDADCNGFVRFQLTGPGVSLATTLDLGSADTQTFPSTRFAPSDTFVAVDNNNPSATRTTFTTTTDSPQIASSSYSPPRTTPSPISPGLTPIQRLGAILSANGAAMLLTTAGKSALNVPQGTTAITLKDTDAKATFVIQQNGSPPIRLTPANFVGRKTVKLLFIPGIWKYYASPHGTVHTFIVVA